MLWNEDCEKLFFEQSLKYFLSLDKLFISLMVSITHIFQEE